eukprot:scpid26331/ scgid5311/ Protein NLRC3; CARD15-like protein; Caterpiller protein 16.2; Nucleotide-binding oligomerization domain protein 3
MEGVESGQLPRTRRKAGVVMEFDEVSEFQSMLASGYRESLALTSVYPLNDNLEPVSPLLVKPRLLATRKVKKRVSQVVKVVGPTEKEEVSLYSMIRAEQSPSLVSIVGGNGSGKSTVLHQLALAWALLRADSAYTDSKGDNKGHQAVPNHLKWVSQYEFVLLLDMELLNANGEEESIKDLIRTQLVSNDSLVRVGRIWRHLQDSEQKVLVLLDNLHCVQSLRMSQLNLLFQRHEDALPHANMVTTCSDNCEMPVPFHQITRRLQIAELSVDEQKQLAAMQFALPADSRDVQQCVKQIHENPFISELASAPFTFMMACAAWKRLGDVPPTVAALLQYTIQIQVERVYYRGFQEVQTDDDIPVPVADGLRKLGQLAVTCLESQKLTCDAVAVEAWCTWPPELLQLGLLRKRMISMQGKTGHIYTFLHKSIADYVAAMWLSFDPYVETCKRPLLDDSSQFSRVMSAPDSDHERLTFSHCLESNISQFNMVYRIACSLVPESKAVRLITALNHKVQKCDSEVTRMDFTVLVLHCLYECTASGDLCDLVSQILGNPIRLHAFDSSLGLSGADLCALAYYLHHCSVRVGHIAVEAGPSADDAAVHKFLGAKGLKVVRFSWHNWQHRNNKTAIGQCTAIGKALQRPSCAISQLKIALTSLTDNVVQDLAFGLKVNASVQHLTLCNLAPYAVPEDLLSDHGVRRLSAALELNTTLTSLCLPGSAMTVEGIKYLARHLESPYCVLEQLDLSPVRYIGDGAVKHLAQSLQRNRTLKTLRLSKAMKDVQSAVPEPGQTAITNESAQSLSMMLQANKCLLCLDIQNHDIGDQGAIFLADGLMRNSTLTSLLLGWSQIGSNGYERLQQAWNSSESLVTLDVTYFEQDSFVSPASPNPEAAREIAQAEHKHASVSFAEA